MAIVGAPNVGKSTLLNALAGREAAITSEFAGTARDVIEVRMDLRGLPVALMDLAGLRETEDPVETVGVRRVRTRAECFHMTRSVAFVRAVARDEGDTLVATATGSFTVGG